MIGGCMCGALDCQWCFGTRREQLAERAIEEIMADEDCDWDEAEHIYRDRLGAAEDAAAEAAYYERIDP